MKILNIVGSYRKNGNTARVVGLIAEGLRQEAVRFDQPLEIETIYLGHHVIHMCRGCRVCFDQGEDKCPLQDDLLAIKTKMTAADGIIIAAPVYVNDVNGIVKNWIDRLAFVCHRPEFADKCAYLVATVADSPTNHALRTLNVALLTWGFHIVGQTGFKTGAWMPPDELTARYQKQTARIARSLFHAIHHQGFARPSFLALMTFNIRQRYWQRTIEYSIDYTYWQNRGWIEPSREFYLQHRASRIKTAFARLCGAVLARFVT